MISDPDPERNRELVAQRLGWPDGALNNCRALEAEFPDWSVFWTNGGLPKDQQPGYRAMTREMYSTSLTSCREHLYEYRATLGELRTALAARSLPARN
ncbi:hypothetical protein [Actinoplanes sp. N902-109]|uniref:hypothetical protein n=1 Tax=Actinoplanes sp. (strain N902-109) TaxID=649831 RepID=UPI000329436D|nr:hypothetical protein [Actinoplanes sp. N902-109]AGL19478.1 hypothetical protein L083_5968 [Actinoplanes sp. N902-109]